MKYLKHEVAGGRGDEPCHVVDIIREQQARNANDGPKPKTRFQVELDDPLLYAEFNIEKDRIVKHCKNKSVALSIMLGAWRGLTGKILDRLLAEGTDISEIA